MARKQVYYNMDKIDDLDCTYNLIFGEKSNGKSYQIKLKKMLGKYYKTKRRFILMRRWDQDIKNNWVLDYFSDMDINTITENKYNVVIKRSNRIYFGTAEFDHDKDKLVEKVGEHIGYVIPISMEQHYSSASFLDVDDIILEEFMERGSYLPREVEKFMAFYSTVDRKRGTTKVWLIGNTITQANPYIYEWGILNIIKNMRQGDIKKIKINTADGDFVYLGIEYCESSGGKSMTIGHTAKMIDSGSWQANPQPHLPKSKKFYKILYRIGFLYRGFKYLGEYLMDKENYDICWFIYPYDGEFRNIFVFTDVVKTDPYYQRDIYNISIKNEKLQKIFNNFRETHIFYSDDLTGTDFKQVIDFSIRR